MTEIHLTENRLYGTSNFDVLLKKAVDPKKTENRFPDLNPRMIIQDDMIIEYDVAVKLRDGITIYTDIYRPKGQKKIPAIVAWSPYGKKTGDALHTLGVPEDTLSEGTKLEGPDPEYWCRQGYAVINPDPRGVGNSEGTIQIWTREEAKDTADLIDFIGIQEWCNGRVGMAGNSWLAISQWAAAAENPKHLVCIAPWEGSTDPYKQIFVRGGIPDLEFSKYFDNATLTGQGMAESLVLNKMKHPMEDEYWLEKLAQIEKIDIPAYVCAGWQHFHLQGSIEGFNRLKSKKKWLRIHREFEWPDQYTPENLADLKLFFDRYLKEEHNGWELTPPVRIDVMDRGDCDHVEKRRELSFPLSDTTYRKFYLDTENKTLSKTLSQKSSVYSYDATSGHSVFDYTFNQDTELTGYLKLRLWVEAEGSDDMDLFVAVQKADEDGEFVPTLVMGHAHPGAEGMLRVSHRQLNTEQSTEYLPVHDHKKRMPLNKGEIVPIEIPIWPTSKLWHKGERLRVVISGNYQRENWVEPLVWDVKNKGRHKIYSGGNYDSYLLVPEIPKQRQVFEGNSRTSKLADMSIEITD